MIPAPTNAGASTRVHAPHATNLVRDPDGSGALLPQPRVSETTGDMEHALLAIYALLDQQAKVQGKTAKIGIEAKRSEEHTQIQNELEGIRKQQEAEREGHGLWSSVKKVTGAVGKIAAVVAGVAAVVCSGGAAAPLVLGIAAVALSAGGAVVKETHCFGKSSDTIGTGMEIGGAVCSGAGSFASASGSAVSAASETGSVASSATTSTHATFAVVGGTASATGGAASVTEGVADIRLAGFESDRLRGGAEQEAALNAVKALRDQEQRQLAWLKVIQEVKNDAQGSVADALDGIHQARLAAAAGVRA